jgi:hypothetical protein
MTDARLPGPWLTRLSWMRLSDRAVRTLAQSLMWSNEAGSDGDLPTDCHHYLHPLGVDDATAGELIAAGWWERTPTGYRVPDWTGTAGQESAAKVANRRANQRRRQQDHRDRQRDVTRDIAGYLVGQDRQGQAVTEHTLIPTSPAAADECVPPGECQRRTGFGQPPCPQHQQKAGAACFA